MQEFVLLAGLPGSGKSTLSKRLKSEQGFFVVSSDSIRLALNAGCYPRGDQEGDYALLEPIVWELVQQAVAALLKAGKNVALDATNLTRSKRATWLTLARDVAPDVRCAICWCTGNYDSPARWANERGHSEEEYWIIRRRLEAAVEMPRAEENAEVHFVPPLAT